MRSLYLEVYCVCTHLKTFAETTTMNECMNEWMDEWGVNDALRFFAIPLICSLVEALAVEEPSLHLQLAPSNTRCLYARLCQRIFETASGRASANFDFSKSQRHFSNKAPYTKTPIHTGYYYNCCCDCEICAALWKECSQ